MVRCQARGQRYLPVETTRRGGSHSDNASRLLLLIDSVATFERLNLWETDLVGELREAEHVFAERDGSLPLLEDFEQLQHGVGGGEEQADGEDDEFEAQGANLVQRQGWRFAAVGPVEEQRYIGKGTGDRLQFLQRAWSLNKDHVRARLAVGPSAPDGVFQPVD